MPLAANQYDEQVVGRILMSLPSSPYDNTVQSCSTFKLQTSTRQPTSSDHAWLRSPPGSPLEEDVILYSEMRFG